MREYIYRCSRYSKPLKSGSHFSRTCTVNSVSERPNKKGNMADSATPKRHMKFPYTFTAKMVQFPYRYYINNCWPYKYYLISVLLVSPLFIKITSAVNSAENKAKWYAIRKKELEPHH